MKLLEYEAKDILKESQVPVAPSYVIHKEAENHTVSAPIVLKSQVPVGGRGKAGGVVVVNDQDDIETTIERLFKLDIRGHKPHTLLAEEKLVINREFYLSLVINRGFSAIELIAHINGGIEVESNQSDTFLRIDTSSADWDSIGQSLADYYNLPEQTFALQDLVERLHDCFVKNDATLLEINPLVFTQDGKLVAGDCKMTLDDSAAFRHPNWKFEDEPTGANFVTLNENGAIATIANGAGLAMATVDAVANYGMEPVNFLDIGGGANSESVLAAFKKIMEYPNVQGIVINIFAGITRCDEVAKAIIEARSHIDSLPPLFIRLAGTNVEAATELLAEHNIPLLPTLEACLAAAQKEVSHG